MDEINSNDSNENYSFDLSQIKTDYSNYSSQNEPDILEELESFDNYLNKYSVYIPSGPVGNVTLLHKIISEENREKVIDNYLYGTSHDLKQVPYSLMKKSYKHKAKNCDNQTSQSDSNQNEKNTKQTIEQTQQSEYEYKIKMLKSYKKTIRDYLTEFCEENFIEEYQRQNLEAMVFAAFDGAVNLTDKSIPASEISLYEDYKAF